MDSRSSRLRRRGRSRPHPPRHVYYRRRLLALVGVLVVLWLLLQALGGAIDWFAGDRSEAATPPATTPTATTARPSTTEPPGTEAPVCTAPGDWLPEATDEPPPALTAAVETALAHRSFEIRPEQVSASIWMDGYGDVAALDPDRALAPASNQKILTAMGALELLDPADTLTTELRATGPVTDGVVDGDLVVVAGGDPLIKRVGPHSLEDLANRLAEEGITRISGDVVGDETRYDQIRRAPGWLDWEMPLPGGAISAFAVNSNSRVGDQAYLENPTSHNVDLFVQALETAGIDVAGNGRPGPAPVGAELVLAYESPTVGELVQLMLRHSDNMAAELLTKEIGLQVAGDPSTAGGLAAIVEALEQAFCLEIDGANDDASGISRDNRRSAAGWRDLLLAARDAPWFETFYEGLPVAGSEDGTLANRFLGSEAAGDVHAKTGSIGTAIALSGYFETNGGRPAVFSIVVNGNDPSPARAAMDALVVAVAADRT